jgi:hypothetical protein
MGIELGLMNRPVGITAQDKQYVSGGIYDVGTSCHDSALPVN